MKSQVSDRGQTVIPKKIRDQLGIRAKAQLEWLVVGNAAMVLPVSENPIQEAYGILKGGRASTRSLLRFRAEDQELERKR